MRLHLHGEADMAPAEKPFVIALEEHYYDYDSAIAATFDSPEGQAPEILRRLDDLGELRLKEVDWPFGQNVPRTKWIHEPQLSAEDKAKILSGNARRLLKM